jgi:hypothetical protein
VLGIASGEQLRIIWPGAKQTASGPDERSCEPFAMFAMLFPEKLADAAMAQTERVANDPAPLSERPTRIAALEREIEDLSQIEEALIEAAIARGRDHLSVAVGAAAGSARRQDRGAQFARRLRLSPSRPAYGWAVPLGRWTAINSREPADRAPSGRGGHPTARSERRVMFVVRASVRLYRHMRQALQPFQPGLVDRWVLRFVADHGGNQGRMPRSHAPLLLYFRACLETADHMQRNQTWVRFGVA